MGLARPSMTTRSVRLEPLAHNRRPFNDLPKADHGGFHHIVGPTVNTSFAPGSDTTAVSGINRASTLPRTLGCARTALAAITGLCCRGRRGHAKCLTGLSWLSTKFIWRSGPAGLVRKLDADRVADVARGLPFTRLIEPRIAQEIGLRDIEYEMDWIDRNDRRQQTWRRPVRR